MIKADWQALILLSQWQNKQLCCQHSQKFRQRIYDGIVLLPEHRRMSGHWSMSISKLFNNSCRFSIPRVKTAVWNWMAGLLTDSLPDSFPTLTIYTRSVVKVNIKKLNRVSQQRDCPGFTPDSLLIQIVDMAIWNQFGGKDSEFI